MFLAFRVQGGAIQCRLANFVMERVFFSIQGAGRSPAMSPQFFLDGAKLHLKKIANYPHKEN
jgi:hypothetical protein